MTVGAVGANHVHAYLLQGGGPVEHIAGNTQRGAHQQAAVTVFYRIRMAVQLEYVTVGDEPYQCFIFFDNGQLFNFVRAQYFFRFLQVGAFGGDDQVFRVITSCTLRFLSSSKRRSRLVRIPTSLLSWSTMGMPPILFSFISFRASPIVAST